MAFDPWSAAAGAVLDVGSTIINQDFARKRQHDAQDFSAQQFANRYQTTTADMKKAGLNPMLAYQQGGGSSPSGSPTSPAGGSDMAGRVNQTRLASAQEAQIRAQERNTNSDTLVKIETAKNIVEDTKLKSVTAEQVQKTSEKITNEIQQIQSTIDNLKQQTRTGKAQEDLNRKIAILEERKAELTLHQSALTKQEVAIGTPKEQAAAMATGKGAAIAENIWKIITPFKGGK